MDQAILLGKRKLNGASTRSLNWHGFRSCLSDPESSKPLLMELNLISVI